MKPLFSRHAGYALLLLACTGCGQDIFATHNTPQDLQQMQQGALSTKTQPIVHHAPEENTGAPVTTMASGNYASDGQNCNARAQSRMSMYDRPDTYPISDQERHDAFTSLYSACMREHDWQVAGPAHAPANYASQFANLAPAAGGPAHPVNTVNAGNTVVSTSSVPGATVVVVGGGNASNLAAQMSSLSPSAGGSTPGATVVMVGQPQQPAYAAPTYIPYPAAQPLPVAVPIAPPPMAKAYAPMPSAAVAYAPRQRPSSALPTGDSYSAQPSLAGAEASASGTSGQAANRQLENVLDQ